jgi:hypothetical protein
MGTVYWPYRTVFTTSSIFIIWDYLSQLAISWGEIIERGNNGWYGGWNNQKYTEVLHATAALFLALIN